VMIHSGTMLNRRVDSDGKVEVLDEYPSVYQGYGRVTLNKVLNFGDSSVKGEGLSLFVRGGARSSDDYHTMLHETGEEHQYQFVTSDSEVVPIRVTIAFTDPPPGISWTVAGVNSLGLSLVEEETGMVYLPYEAFGTSGNNVKMINLESPKLNSSYVVKVSATSLQSNQSYALVVTGNITTFAGMGNANTTTVDVDHSGIGVSSSVLAAIFILGSACIALIIVLASARRENNRLILLYNKAVLANNLREYDLQQDLSVPDPSVPTRR